MIEKEILAQIILDFQKSSLPELQERELKSLLKASELSACRDLKVVTFDYEAVEKVKSKKIKFIPLWKWLLNREIVS